MRYKIPLMRPIISKEMTEAATNALQNERLVLGESVSKFEEEFADFIGTKHARSVSSGTDGLMLSLLALTDFLDKGKEIITTPASFAATANVILHVNGYPKFADIKLSDYTIDPEEIKECVFSDETIGIIPVHLYGYPADMDRINEIAKEDDLIVIEDACQSHGAVYKGKKTGSLSDVGVFSFYSSKNMTVGGDGGMVTTNNEDIAKEIESLRHAGRRIGSHYIHDLIGFTSRLDTFKAAIGRIQLRELPKWNEKRREVARKYDQHLSDLDQVILPPKPTQDVKPVYYVYIIRTEKRDQLKDHLEKNGIETGILYPIPIHLQPAYRKMGAQKILENEDGFRWDIFDRQVCNALTVSTEMKSRATQFYKKGPLEVLLASKEDIFLFKGVTEREADLDDMRLLAESGVDWKVIEQECHVQSASSGRLWENALYERLIDLREKYNIESPIEKSLEAIVEEKLVEIALVEAIKQGNNTVKMISQAIKEPQHFVRKSLKRLIEKGRIRVNKSRRPYKFVLNS